VTLGDTAEHRELWRELVAAFVTESSWKMTTRPDLTWLDVKVSRFFTGDCHSYLRQGGYVSIGVMWNMEETTGV